MYGSASYTKVNSYPMDQPGRGDKGTWLERTSRPGWVTRMTNTHNTATKNSSEQDYINYYHRKKTILIRLATQQAGKTREYWNASRTNGGAGTVQEALDTRNYRLRNLETNLRQEFKILQDAKWTNDRTRFAAVYGDDRLLASEKENDSNIAAVFTAQQDNITEDHG